MKKYTIHLNYYATIDIDVLAENRQQARELAMQDDTPLNEFDFDLNDVEVLEEQEIEDPEKLIRQADSILQRALKQGEAYQLPFWPTITIQTWDGLNVQQQSDILQSVYWDEERDEIGLETDKFAEITISDLSEVQQYEVAKAIVDAQLHNLLPLS